MTDLTDQIDALLALNAKGAVSHRIPGLAVELLERASAALALTPAGGGEVVAKVPTQGLPQAYGGCTCSCHRTPGIMHIAACCRPSDDEREPLITREWFERKVALEGDSDVSAGSSPAAPSKVVEATDEMVFAAMRKADELGFPLDDMDARAIILAALGEAP